MASKPTHRRSGHPPAQPQEEELPRIDARPSNVVYDPRTGPGTGTAARRTHIRNPDGSYTPVSGLGKPLTGSAAPVESAASLSERRSRAALEFNTKNPGLHQDEATGIVTVHPDAERRIAEAEAKAQNQGAGKPAGASTPAAPAATTPPIRTPFFNVGGQAASMRAASAPQPGTDRYGRTSASPSAGGMPMPPRSAPMSSEARGDWQTGSRGTTSISSGYGTGSVSRPPLTPPSGPTTTNAQGQQVSQRLNTGIPSIDAAGAGPSPRPPRPPATFEGKPRDQFFTEAATRQRRPNAYSPSSYPSMVTGKPLPPPDSKTMTMLPPVAKPPAPTPAPAPASLPPSALPPPVQQPTYPAGSVEQRTQSFSNARQGLDNATGAQAVVNSTGAGALPKAPTAPAPRTYPSMVTGKPLPPPVDGKPLTMMPAAPKPPADLRAIKEVSPPPPRPYEQSAFDRNPVATMADGAARSIGSGTSAAVNAATTGATAAFNAFKQVGEKGAEWFDKTYIHNEALNPPAIKPPAPAPVQSPMLTGNLPPKPSANMPAPMTMMPAAKPAAAPTPPMPQSAPGTNYAQQAIADIRGQASNAAVNGMEGGAEEKKKKLQGM